MELLNELYSIFEKSTPGLDVDLFEAKLTKYGLILDTDDGDVKYDDFDTVEVFTDKISMQRAIISRFVDWSNDVKGTKFSKALTWGSIKETDEFQDWLNSEICWIVDKLGALK